MHHLFLKPKKNTGPKRLRKASSWLLCCILSCFFYPSAQAEFLGLPDEDLIIYPSQLLKDGQKQTKSIIGLFTDIDCEFCQEQHHEISKLNAKGVEVRIIAFPRSADAKTKASWLYVFCNENPKLALNQIMSHPDNTVLPKNNHCSNPINKHLDLVKKYKIRGTPATILSPENIHSGFLSAKEILNLIKEL
ncbi:MAG: thioredoxin fold domain-containing protein [Gammaproteobacteria bacterium]